MDCKKNKNLNDVLRKISKIEQESNFQEDKEAKNFAVRSAAEHLEKKKYRQG